MAGRGRVRDHAGAMTSLLFLCVLAAEPDWVMSGGTSPKYSPRTHLLGFGVAAGSDIEAAKSQASAQLAQQITVRIESEQSDVSAEKNGQQTYAVTAFTRATTDVRVSGMKFETYSGGGKAYALAVLVRATAASERRVERDRLLLEAKEAVLRGEQMKRDEATAMRTYLGARTALAEALDHEAIARVLAGQDEVSAGLPQQVAALNSTIDGAVASLLKTATTTLESCESSLALQLSQQGIASGSNVTVAPLSYGVTSFSSLFGRKIATDLEAKIAQSKLLAGKAVSGALAIKGTYTDDGDVVRVIIVARDAVSGRAIASAEASAKKSALPKDLALVPQNLQQALVDQKILAQGEDVTGKLSVEVWTSKGRSNLVFGAKEEVKVFMRVNKPCFVRLVYLLASGMKVPLEQAYYIDASKTNFAVEYPDTFEVTAPFGVEYLHAVAFTEKPEPLPTVPKIVDGEKYEVVTETVALVKHRGLTKKKAEAQTAEAILTLTTMPR